MAVSHAPLSPNLQRLTSDGLENLRLRGRDGSGNERWYIPYDRLKGYWEDSRVKTILSHLPVPPPVDVIQQKYLRVFSVLALLNRIQYLDVFTSRGLCDHFWPQNETPPRWPLAFPSLLEEFKHAQWMFFPLEFDRHELISRKVSNERILPIENERILKLATPNDDGVKLSKVTIHSSCNKLESYDHKRTSDDDDAARRTNDTFLFKTYTLYNAEQEAAYHREKDAYALMAYSGGSSEHVARYYGSFDQGGRGHLILEYVSSGTLSTYLQRTNNPQTAEAIYHFWTSMLGLPEGLRKIHQVVEGPSRSFRRAIIHQDLKLDNILVAKRNGMFPYLFQTKLIDLGHSGIATARDGEDELVGTDLHGNATHSGPEATHHNQALENGPDTLVPASDIWALGCILLQIAAWVAEGMDNFVTFRIMRYEELWKWRESGYGQSFHKGGAKVLQSVRDTHQLILNQLDRNNRQDEITPRILDLVVKHMLVVERSRRFTAKEVWCQMDNILNDHEPEPGQNDTKISNVKTFIGSINRLDSQRRTEREPLLTVDQCVQYRNNMKSDPPTAVDPTVHSHIQKLIKTLRVRDHIFLIDDSLTMSHHRDDIVRVFSGLSYVARFLDDDGIELAFISSPNEVKKSRSTSTLIDIIKAHSFEHEPGMMEAKLEDFVDNAVIKKLPNKLTRHLRSLYRKDPVTVFVLTDGRWGSPNSNQTGGVQNPILKLMNKMIALKIPRTKVMVQFLRFGDNRDGKTYLKHLDNMGQQLGQ